MAIALGMLVLIGGITWVYSRTLAAPFVFDDSAAVVNNPSIGKLWPLWHPQQPTPLHPGPDLPTSARPLVNLTFALNYAVGRLDPRGYHLVNLALHVVAALLLWGVVSQALVLVDASLAHPRFGKSIPWLGFVVALVWALHPLQSESVAYVTQRTELMMGVCYLGTFYACLKYWTARTISARAAMGTVAAIFCLAGMFCKEMMVSSPAVILLFERTFLRGSFRAALRASWPLYVGLSLSWILLALAVLLGERTPSAGFGQGIGAMTWWCTQAKALAIYLKLCFWPWPLVIHYDFPKLDTWTAAWPWVLPVVLCVGAVFFLAWRKNWIGFLGVSLLAILSPTLVVPLVTEVAAERRMYLPLAAVVVLVVIGSFLFVSRLVERSTMTEDSPGARSAPRVTILVAGTLTACLLGLACAGRLAVFRSELALWQDAAEHQADSYVVQFNLGTSLAAVHQPERAIAHFGRALRIKSDSAEAHFNWGRALEELGAQREAAAHYEEATRLKPDFSAAHNNLGLLLAGNDRLQAAIDHYEAALTADANFAPAHTNLAAALASMNRAAEAVEHLQQAVRLAPAPQAFANLAYGYALVHRTDAAKATIRHAIDLARSHGQDANAAEFSQWLQHYERQTGGP
jgi:Flp pilus assembly protein TadD